MALYGRSEKKGKFDPSIPSDDKGLIGWAEKRRDEGRALPEREVYLNMAFMLGHQWVVWDQTRRRLNQAGKPRTGDPNAPVRIQVNKMGGLVERTISRLTKSSPIPECRPVTDEEGDVSAAKVGTRMLQAELNRLGWETMLPRLYFWVLPLGWSFLHVYWDTESGSVVDSEVLPEAERPAEDLHEGNTCLEIVPGTEIRLDPNARVWDEVRWVVRTTNMTRAAIYEMYGATEVSGDAAPMRDVSEDIFALSDGSAGDGTKTNKDKVERLAVHQLWLKPGGRTKPEGLVLTWSGDTVLEGPMPFPYDHGHLPFVPFSLLPGLGHPEGRTWLSDLRGMQEDYNDARSREATIRRTLVPKILAARGQIDPQRLTSRVEVVEYAPTGERPTWEVPNSGWMQQFEAAMQRADMEMGDRAGQAEVSQGRAPAGAPAAAILALQEADESKLAISAKELARATEQMGHQVLMLARQFWTEERIIRTWSEDGKLEVMRFRGADLPNQLDVQVSAESMLPKSKSARAQLALDLWDRQILTDPSAFVRMLELPGVSFLQDEFDRDARQADREYGRMVFGEEVQAEDWHNHQAHIAKHNSDRKTEEWEQIEAKARAGDPQAAMTVQIMEKHVRQHYEWMAYQQTGILPPDFAGGSPGPFGMSHGEGGQPNYTDPLTGQPPDPLAAASGLGPSALSMNPPAGVARANTFDTVNAIRDQQFLRNHGVGGIGGPGQQGAVPGISRDQQAAQTGQ